MPKSAAPDRRLRYDDPAEKGPTPAPKPLLEMPPRTPNTGVVIAGTIGCGGKLELTLISDAVNVAARVEQLTKTTGDETLITNQTVDALA